ncbi:MAG: hypothetical protein ACXVDD_20575 [Polyangia bacterium]
MTRLACTVMVTLGVFLALGATARAQDFEAAGRHFSAAQEAFGAKHFKTAAGEFEAAYGITKDPVLLYNVAESYEKAGDGHKAVANYKSYLKEQPAAQDKAEVQRRIRAIEQKGYKLASQSAPGDNPPTTATTAPTTPPPTMPATPPPTTPAPPPVTATTPPATPPPSMPSTAPTTPPPTPTPAPGDTVLAPPPEPAPAPAATPPPAEQPPPGLLDEGPASKLRVGAWIGVAATLAVLTAGAIFGLSAESRADEINRRLSFVDTANQPHKFDQSMQSDLQSLKDDGNLYNGLAIGFYTVAAVGAVATVTMFIVDAKRGKPEKKQAWHLAPVVGKNAGGFALGGSF